MKSSKKIDRAYRSPVHREVHEFATLSPRLGAAKSLSVAVAVVVLLTYLPFCRVPTFDFVGWDDQVHVYGNPYLQSFNVGEIAHFWTHSYCELYIPLSYTAFALLTIIAHHPGDTQNITDSGAPLDPNVFHAASLLMHLANTVMVLLFIRRITRNDLASVVGALLFGVHPLQVESVAWISELRGLMAAMFTLISIHLFMTSSKVLERRDVVAGSALFVASVLTSACAMLSKPSSIVIGLFVAAIAHWHFARNWKQSILAAIPFGLLGFILTLVTARLQNLPPGQVVSVWLRPFVASDALNFYLEKLVLPLNLAIDYGRTPTWVLAHWWVYWTWIAPATASVLAVSLRRRFPLLPLGLFLAIASLIPVLGLTPFDFQHISTTADRYTYMAMIGVAVAVSAVVANVPVPRRTPAGIVCAACFVALSILTYNQANIWRTSMSLFENAVRVNSKSAVAQNGLGTALQQQRQFGNAIPHYLAAVSLDPSSAQYCTNLGEAYAGSGDYEHAELQFRRAIKMDPKSASSLRDLGTLLMDENRSGDGSAFLQMALNVDPGDSVAAENLSAHYAETGDYLAAIGVCETAVRYSSNVGPLWRNLGLALCAVNRRSEAVRPLENAVSLDPADEAARNMLESITSSQSVP